jgi:hypothetical protein
VKILIILAVVIVAFVAVVAMQPADFRLTRSTTISAPASVVFAQVNDFHNWKAWSPWAKRDPAMKEHYDGPPSGVGAIYHWEGNKEVGEGRMTIMESLQNDKVTINLEFLKPFEATNTAEFTFEPRENQTVVEWSMYGKKNFMMKAFHMFISMEKMVGPDFEKGLAAMKSTVEAMPKQ